jgi:hypothetical protein
LAAGVVQELDQSKYYKIKFLSLVSHKVPVPIEPEVSSPHSENRISGSYPELNQSTYFASYFCNIDFNYILFDQQMHILSRKHIVM